VLLSFPLLLSEFDAVSENDIIRQNLFEAENFLQMHPYVDPRVVMVTSIDSVEETVNMLQLRDELSAYQYAKNNNTPYVRHDSEIKLIVGVDCEWKADFIKGNTSANWTGVCLIQASYSAYILHVVDPWSL